MARPLMKHNPAFLSKEDLVRSFVVRHADLDLVLERLREGGEGPNQHMLLIGPRGIGKTTLVLRVAAAIEAESVLQGRWYPLLFGEESYEVGTAAEFWLEAISHLADRTGDARWRATYDELKKQRDEKRLYEQALARLMDFADEQGKRLLIIAENLNMILGEQLSSDDGWVLRHTLQNEQRIMLLATATMRFDEIDSVDRAMYDLFWTYDLRPLDAEECRRLWTAITGQEISQDRIRPIQILTGGSPRLLAILATFASGLSFRELMAELAQLVDDHTSYFKSNLEGLPTLERKVYVAVADIWSPATAREIAASARIEINKASSLLHRLVSRGAVVEVKQQGRRTSYQVAERMYNIYHLMRRHAGEGSRVRAVVDFMVHLYEHQDLVRVARSLTGEAFEVEPGSREDYFWAYAGILERAGSPELWVDIVLSTDDRFFELPDAPSFIRDLVPEKSIDESEESIRARVEKSPDDAVLLAKWALVLCRDPGRVIEAEQVALRATKVAPSHMVSWYVLGAVLTQNRRFDEAERIFRFAIERWPENYQILLIWASFLEHLERYDEAANVYERRLAIVPAEARTLMLLGKVRLLQRRYVDAEESYKALIGTGADKLEVWRGLSAALIHQSRWQDAEAPLRRVVELSPDDAHAWCSLGFVLVSLSKIDEAEVVSRRAIQGDPLHSPSWVVAGMVASCRANFNEAEKAFRRAIRLGSKVDVLGEPLRILVREYFKSPTEISRASRRFLRATEGRSVGLDALARKVLLSGWSTLYPNAELWSQEAVIAEPDNLRFRFTLACLSGALGKWPTALAEVSRFLADPTFASKNMSEIIDFFISAAAVDQSREVLACLTASPAKLQLEPLVVALQMVLGEDYNAPQEVVEVAKDVVARIDARKQAAASMGAPQSAPASAPVANPPPTKPKLAKNTTKITAKKRPPPASPPKPPGRTKRR